ncbi:uncharacterized protein C1orf50 homolog isoform X1 [Atheta coriaria]|uniref:uncharacterized protein C1orf50 homolog isoform X1 n=1 Tax=Dalotia coriaria TaxID=877792 RepID=UPI0031F3639D
MKRISSEPKPYDEIAKVCLVERNASPGGLSLVNANKVGKKSANDLVDLAMEIQQADAFLTANTCNKLQVIVQQVQYLKQQAHQILQEAEKDAELHRVACNFTKVSGNVYHLYERQSGQKYFSMLSPEEWTSPHQYHGSYRLEVDQSWTELSNIVKKDYNMQAINAIIQSKNPLALAQHTHSMPMDI